jgi:hypothetical protein
MNDDRTVPMDSNNPWANDEEQKTVVDGNDKTVPMDGYSGPPGGERRTPFVGDYDETVAEDSGPFQRTNPRDQPTPTPGGWGGGLPQYDTPPPAPQPSPYQQRPPSGGGEEGKTQIMSAGTPETLPLAWLAVVEGPGAPRGEVFRLGKDTILGRTSNNHIPLSGDPAVSSRHLKIKLEAVDEEDPEQKVFVLYDQGSANGTYAGAYEECQEAKNRVYRRVLEDGDFLLLGETILVFKSVDLA